MFDFERTYEELVLAEGGSPELKPLLSDLYAALVTRPADFSWIKRSLCSTLEFLNTPEGLTDANCKAVDLFLCCDEDWEHDCSDLPDDFMRLVFDMGCELHDTFQAPHVAEYFQATPEQLLRRARGLKAA